MVGGAVGEKGGGIGEKGGGVGEKGGGEFVERGVVEGEGGD